MREILPFQHPDTINWDPFSDSIVYNASVEDEAVDDGLYRHLDLDENFLMRYVKIIGENWEGDKVFGPSTRVLRFLKAQNWHN